MALTHEVGRDLVSHPLSSSQHPHSTFFYLNEFEAFRDGPRDLSGFYRLMEVVSTIGYSIMLGATAIYVVLWLEARRDR